LSEERYSRLALTLLNFLIGSSPMKNRKKIAEESLQFWQRRRDSVNTKVTGYGGNEQVEDSMLENDPNWSYFMNGNYDDPTKLTMKERLLRKYGTFALNEAEVATDYDLRNSISLRVMFLRLQDMTGVTFNEHVLKHLLTAPRGDYAFVEGDLLPMVPRIKHMNIVDLAGGKALYMAAIEELHPDNTSALARKEALRLLTVARYRLEKALASATVHETLNECSLYLIRTLFELARREEDWWSPKALELFTLAHKRLLELRKRDKLNQRIVLPNSESHSQLATTPTTSTATNFSSEARTGLGVTPEDKLLWGQMMCEWAMRRLFFQEANMLGENQKSGGGLGLVTRMFKKACKWLGQGLNEEQQQPQRQQGSQPELASSSSSSLSSSSLSSAVDPERLLKKLEVDILCAWQQVDFLGSSLRSLISLLGTAFKCKCLVECGKAGARQWLLWAATVMMFTRLVAGEENCCRWSKLFQAAGMISFEASAEGMTDREIIQFLFISAQEKVKEAKGLDREALPRFAKSLDSSVAKSVLQLLMESNLSVIAPLDKSHDYKLERQLDIIDGDHNISWWVGSLRNRPSERVSIQIVHCPSNGGRDEVRKKRHQRMELQHPNINRLVNVFLVEKDGELQIWQVHQNVDPDFGCINLAQLVDVCTDMDELVVVALLHQILQGLQFLHSKGFKMEPEMTSRSIFIDFSTRSVRLLNSFNMETVKGRYSACVDSPKMNVRQGGNKRGRKADIFSLGLIAMELVGMQPEDDLSESEFFLDHPSTFTLTNNWSSEFHNFVSLCVTRDYNSRPSAEDLLEHAVFQQLENVDVSELFHQCIIKITKRNNSASNKASKKDAQQQMQKKINPKLQGANTNERKGKQSEETLIINSQPTVIENDLGENQFSEEEEKKIELILSILPTVTRAEAANAIKRAKGNTELALDFLL
jgi:serine/threonine protein kinase